MKYSREGPRDFVPFEYEEVTIDNIKKACQKHFKEHRNCDVLASEQGPSCSRIDQLPSLKIIHIRFTMICLESGIFQKYLLFQKHQIFQAFRVSIPKAMLFPMPYQHRHRHSHLENRVIW